MVDASNAGHVSSIPDQKIKILHGMTKKKKKKEKVIGYQGFREKGEWEVDGEISEGFRIMKLFCMMLYWQIQDTVHLSKPTEYTIPRVNPDVNPGLQVIIVLSVLVHQLQ